MCLFVIGFRIDNFIEHLPEFAGSHHADTAYADAACKSPVRSHDDQIPFIMVGFYHFNNSSISIGTLTRVKDSDPAVARSIRERMVRRAIEDHRQSGLFQMRQSRQISKQLPPRSYLVTMPSYAPADYIVAINQIHHLQIHHLLSAVATPRRILSRPDALLMKNVRSSTGTLVRPRVVLSEVEMITGICVNRSSSRINLRTS